MITLILIGGNSTRFRDAGYNTPKALLPMPSAAGSATMLDAILDTLHPDGPIIISGRAEMRGWNTWDWPLYWRQIELAYVWSDGKAAGPLAGVVDAGAHLARAGESLLVSYCDVLFPLGVEHILHHWRGCHSGAVLFESHDERFGYWKAGRVWEKMVKSRWAVSGLFYFRSASECVRAALRKQAPGAGLPALLDWRTKMYYTHGLELLDLGMPQDYQRFMAEGAKV